MPWGWECRSRLIKQVPLKPTERRPTKWDGHQPPGPNFYEPPELFCGKGYSKIKKAPAYSFGMALPIISAKPAAVPGAPMMNIRGYHRKGPEKIPQGQMGENCQPPLSKLQVPGPGAYTPKPVTAKSPPAYSIASPAKPPYQPWDMWTPSPNMYCPPIMKKKLPAYSFGYPYVRQRPDNIPGPGQHDLNDRFSKKNKPAYSFGYPHRELRRLATPAPNAYCVEKKYKYGLRRAPAPSFGIKHSPHLGQQHVHELPSKLELLGKDLV